MGVFCHDTQSRGITVKPVYRAEGKRGADMRKVISERIIPVLYRRVYGHSSGLIEDYNVFVFEGNGHAERRIRLKKACVLMTENNNIPGVHRIDTADCNTVSCNAVILPFELCQKAS